MPLLSPYLHTCVAFLQGEPNSFTTPSTSYPQEPRTIGDHLWKKRLDLGLLQKEVAQRMGADTDSVTNFRLCVMPDRLRGDG